MKKTTNELTNLTSESRKSFVIGGEITGKMWKEGAKFFGSERTPLSGGNSKITRSDSLHPDLFIETKYRVKHSAVTLWRDTKEKADKENKLPVVCLVERGKPGFFIVCHSSDVKSIARGVK